jgi:sugar lactone lactonase YvrE
MQTGNTDIDRLQFLGTGLSRPECVLTHASGLLFASDWAGPGGVAVVAPDGCVARLRIADTAVEIRPNGIALEPGGSFLVAHLGAETGGLYRLFPDGTHEPVLLALDGIALPPSNFPLRDAQGRIWLTVSTRKSPRALDYRPDAASGFIVLIDTSGARIVADGLGYTNEVALSPDGRHLFVNETFGRRLTRFAIGEDGSLSDRQTVYRFGPGDYPDGLTFDAEGRAWVTGIVSNRVIRIDVATGERLTVLEDSVPSHVAEAELAFRANAMGRPHLDIQPAARLRNISSLAFGGPDLRTAYLGCLLGDSIAAFRTDVPGARPAHFDFDISPLLDQLEF